MSVSARPPAVQVFAAPLWLRLLMLGCALFIGLLMLALLVGLALEGPSRGLALAGAVLAGMGLLSLVVVARSFRRAVLAADHVSLGLPLIARRIPLHAVRRVVHGNGIELHTAQGTVRCRLALRDVEARFVQALEARLPEGAAAVARALPWTWRPRREVVATNIGMALGFGLGAPLLALGIATVVVERLRAGALLEAAAAGGFVLLLLALGALMGGLFLWSFRWAVVFGPDHILEVFPARRRRHPVAALRDITVAGEQRRHKGHTRQAWWLALHLEGVDEALRIEPTENGVAMAHSPEADHRELCRMRDELRGLYGLDRPPPLAGLLAGARARDPDTLAEDFEGLRDELAALRDPDGVLPAALDPENAPLRELLITVLADFGHGPAMVHMVDWLDDADEQIRFVAAMALDGLAGGRFGVEACIVGGWVQHDQIRAKVPALRDWWAEEGPAAAAARTRRAARQPPPPVASAHDQRCNFLAANPDWAMLGDGEVRPPATPPVLPRGPRPHLVAGTIHEAGDQRELFAVFQMDPAAGGPAAAWVKGKQGWVARRQGRDRWAPRWRFGP